MNRAKTVFFDQHSNMWYASNQCIQKDFDESPIFMRSKLTGVESVLDAVNILLNDKNFRKYFMNNPIMFLNDNEHNRFNEERLIEFRDRMVERRSSPEFMI